MIYLPEAHVSEHTSDTKNFEVITATPERLAVSPGAKLSHLVAGAEGTDRQGNVFSGGERVGDRAVSRARSIAVVCVATQGAGLGTGRTCFWGARPSVKFARFDGVTSDMVEIVIGDVVVRVGSGVAPERLAAVIRAVRQARSRQAFRFTWPARGSTSATERPA